MGAVWEGPRLSVVGFTGLANVDIAPPASTHLKSQGAATLTLYNAGLTTHGRDADKRQRG